MLVAAHAQIRDCRDCLNERHAARIGLKLTARLAIFHANARIERCSLIDATKSVPYLTEKVDEACDTGYTRRCDGSKSLSVNPESRRIKIAISHRSGASAGSAVINHRSDSESRSGSSAKRFILSYRRVAEGGSDPFSLCVTPSHFSDQLEILQALARPISLQELVHKSERFAVRRLLQFLPDAQRHEVLRALGRWAGLDASCRPSHRQPTLDEIRELVWGWLMEAACISVVHPVLADLPIDAQRREIVESKAAIERIVGTTVTSFAYPFGSTADYTAETAAPSAELAS